MSKIRINAFIPEGLCARVFPRRLTSGGIFNDRLSFSHCFLEIFVGDKALMEEDKSVIGGSGSPSLPTS